MESARISIRDQLLATSAIIKARRQNSHQNDHDDDDDDDGIAFQVETTRTK